MKLHESLGAVSPSPSRPVTPQRTAAGSWHLRVGGDIKQMSASKKSSVSAVPGHAGPSPPHRRRGWLPGPRATHRGQQRGTGFPRPPPSYPREREDQGFLPGSFRVPLSPWERAGGGGRPSRLQGGAGGTEGGGGMEMVRNPKDIKTNISCRQTRSSFVIDGWCSCVAPHPCVCVCVIIVYVRVCVCVCVSDHCVCLCVCV